jgi:hypothetical protein
MIIPLLEFQTCTTLVLISKGYIPGMRHKHAELLININPLQNREAVPLSRSSFEIVQEGKEGSRLCESPIESSRMDP